MLPMTYKIKKIDEIQNLNSMDIYEVEDKLDHIATSHHVIIFSDISFSSSSNYRALINKSFP